MIEARNLTKHFGPIVAVDNVSFTVERGEVLGFLGPNAAGKSTTIRMLTGFLPPTAGTAIIGGNDIIKSSLAARSEIGYLPENAPSYPDMTVTGFLEFISEIRGYSGSEKRRRIGKVIERCFLQEVRFQVISTLSKGFRQRVCFAQSILHDPQYLIMDEPTDGLDPNQKHEVRTMIREMGREKTIILSTHILEEVEAICTRVVIIANGKIVADNTPEKLKLQAPGHGVIRFLIPDNLSSVSLADLGQVTGVEGIDHVSTDGVLRISVYPEDPKNPPVNGILCYLQEKNAQVHSFQVEEGRLDEFFRNVTTSTDAEVQI
ncbi:MAG TPA: ABC transporter ATP-binding protein [Syntrophales bacterium]|nr:ABC transporter ATP-binding protein [Syntrophales bacterium]HPQ44888.1 ABC transporter ATP-binding protein [Syntrophales bacterium]